LLVVLYGIEFGDCFALQSHAGLFNLCVVVLIAVNSRLIIENLMKVCCYLFLLLGIELLENLSETNNFVVAIIHVVWLVDQNGFLV